MFDSMWSNLAQSMVEAVTFMIWLLPRLAKGILFVVMPIVTVCMLGFLVATKGWHQVKETLTEKLVDKGLEKNWFTYHNQETATKFMGIVASLAIISGIMINASLSAFTLYIAYLLLSLLF
jgi:hypothetical protein